MDVFGITTTLSMTAHFMGSFFFALQAKRFLLPAHAFLLIMALGLLLESWQLSFSAQFASIWWDSAIDMVMNGLGAYVAVRWSHDK